MSSMQVYKGILERLALPAIALIFVLLCYPEVKQGMPPTDDALYGLYADAISKGDFSAPSPEHPNSHYKHRYLVVYPLALVYEIFGVSTLTSMAPFIFCSLVSIYLIYCIGRAIGGTHLGLCAAFLLALYPPFLRISARTLSEPVLVMLVLALFLCVILAVKEEGPLTRKGKLLLFSSGVLCALAVNTHLLTFLLLPPLALCIFYFRDKKFSPTLKAGLFISLGLISTYLIFAVLTPGLIGKQATTQLSYDVQHNVSIADFFPQLIERGRRVLIPAFLFGEDAHYQLFGLAHQLLLIGTEYDLKHSLFHTLLFLGAVCYFFTNQVELLSPQRRAFAATSYPLLLLYLLYEFIALFIVRKLGRYFILLPVLAIIPGAFLLARLVSARTLQKLLLTTAFFLLMRTVAWTVGVDTPASKYLLLGSYFLLLLFLLYEARPFLQNVILGLLIAAGLYPIYGDVVTYKRSYFKEPLEFLYSNFPSPWNLQVAQDVELGGMATWSVMSAFYAGFDGSKLQFHSVVSANESIKEGFLISHELPAVPSNTAELKRFPSGLVLYKTSVTD